MKGLYKFGEYVTEFLVITILLALSAFLILPFVPMLVGVTGFFRNDKDTRRFKDIFTTIGANWKIIIFYTLFQLAIIVLPVLNIYFFNTNLENMNYFVLAVSYIALIVGVVFIVTAPTVIVNMKVNFWQLLHNGVMMLFGGLWRSLLAIACISGVVALIIYFPYVIPLTLYPVPMIVSRLMTENFYKLKAKALGTTVYELKKKQNEDDYLDEYGQIRSEQDDKTENE